MRRLTVLLAAVLAIGACRPSARPAAADASADQAPHPAWSRNAVIYEVNVRQFTPQGTLAALQQHLPRLDELGVDILWLMPVQPIGKLNRKGVLGSYYSIADYTAVNPEFGTEADFKAFVTAAHAQGMKVILDWVPNHSSFDNPWTKNKAFYVTRADGTIINARDNENRETDWTDVAELNYENPEMRQAMISAMRWWLVNTGVDGFRCDVAGGVPNDFWEQARKALEETHPGTFMLAEAEDPGMHRYFDMTYGWELHHLLNDLAQGKAGTSKLDDYFAKQASTFPRDAYRMYFTSNHDENSWSGTEFERMKANNSPAFVLAATVQNGMPLLYTGQEASLDKRLRFFEKDTVDWSRPSRADFYKAMIALKHSQEALRNGSAGGEQTRLQSNGGDRVYAFTRTSGANTVLVALNFGDAPVTATYLALPKPGSYTDWFSKVAVSLGETGSIEIPANGYRVLVK